MYQVTREQGVLILLVIDRPKNEGRAQRGQCQCTQYRIPTYEPQTSSREKAHEESTPQAPVNRTAQTGHHVHIIIVRTLSSLCSAIPTSVPFGS